MLVHGAFADASGWSGVIDRLEHRGYPVLAPANPLRGVAADAAYLRSFLATIAGPIVLVGHSYGGVVITNAATGNPNVKALVYVAAFAPDAGRHRPVAAAHSAPAACSAAPARSRSGRSPRPTAAKRSRRYIALDLFREIFAADLPRKQARAMALSQRPAALQTLAEPSGTPAWRTIPAWYLVAGRDNAIGADTERAMAARIHARKTIEVKGASHVVMISRPTAPPT